MVLIIILILTIHSMQRSLDLTIAASDNPGGVFFFLTPSLSLSEDLIPSGVLQVRRDSQATGLFGRVEVAWEAAYTDGGTHPVPVDAILVNSRGRLVFAAGQTVPETELTLQLNSNSVCELNIISYHYIYPESMHAFVS